jgi:hypothetical protein
MKEHRAWAFEQLGSLRAADRRHRKRGVEMLEALARRPGGTVAGVYKDKAQRQAAYDWLSNPGIRSCEVQASVARATAARCAATPWVYVLLDGTAITLSDRAKTKDVGAIGAWKFPTRGLMAVDALAVSPAGTPLGVLDIEFWARTKPRTTLSRRVKRRIGATEMRHWNAAIARVTDVLEVNAPSTRPWFVMDREADESRILRDVCCSDGLFTIRSSQSRVVEYRGQRTTLFDAVRGSKPRLRHVVDIPRTPMREPRRAVVEVRAIRLAVVLPKHVESGPRTLALNVVEVAERSTRKDRLCWVLLTNAGIDTDAELEHVIASYKSRWRIEEFHRTWKSGSCCVEDIQLRSADAIRKWAIMLAAVATRTEHLKHLARTTPDAPATVELHEDEIAALILAKRQIKTRVEKVPDGIPTIATAVLWIADLGGFSGHYKGYKPGSVTISRGLMHLAIWTDAYRCARNDVENERKMR